MFIYVYIVIRNFKTFIIPKIFSWLKIKIFSQIMGDFAFLSEKNKHSNLQQFDKYSLLFKISMYNVKINKCTALSSDSILNFFKNFKAKLFFENKYSFI